MLGRKMAKKNGEIDKNASIAILGAGYKLLAIKLFINPKSEIPGARKGLAWKSIFQIS